MQTTAEYLGLTAASMFTGVIMSDATWGILIAQVGMVLMMFLKDQKDNRNRVQDRLDRESEARIAREALAKVSELGSERAVRIIEKIEEQTPKP